MADDYKKNLKREYVVTWQSTLDPALGCRKPETFQYCKTNKQKMLKAAVNINADEKISLQAIIEASSAENLKETIKVYFPDSAHIKIRAYNPKRDQEIEHRIKMENVYCLKSRNPVENPRAIIPNISPIKSLL